MFWAGEMVGEIELGDERLNKRLLLILESLAERPEASIPEACGSWAATEAAYRFFANEAVEPERLMRALGEAAAKRCAGRELVLSVQDTTSLDYTRHTDTQGLGTLDHSCRRGLFVHSALAVDPAGGVPLGVVSQQVWARDVGSLGKSARRKALPVEAKESARWLVGVKETEARLGPGTRVVTVADREADIYELFALGNELAGEWLIRARHDRRLLGEERRMLEAVEREEVLARTVVELPRAEGREARVAKLAVRRVRLVLAPPGRRGNAVEKWWEAHPGVERLAPRALQPVKVGVVLVDEVDAPGGTKPVRWVLLTSLPVGTEDEVLGCVGFYRLRWLVERYHYVLKSGCQVERLQLETASRLKRALAVYSLVAWQLLWLTHQARAHPDTPAAEVLGELSVQLLVLPGVPTSTTAADLRSIARKIAMLGGFLGRKGDGEPGVKTLWRGLRRLNDMAAGYQLHSLPP